MFKSLTRPSRPTKLVARFQEHRSPRPAQAYSSPAHQLQIGGQFNHRREFKCPSCSRRNVMEHGDRLLCGCNHLLELYGNGYYWWPKHMVDEEQLSYDRVNQQDLKSSIIERLLVDPVIRDAAKEPSIKDAIEQLEAMIILHKNL